jgi:hypothetical protein
MKTKITVHWVAFAHRAETLKEAGKIPDAKLEFETEIPAAMFDTEILELLFEQTNLYAGDVWSKYFEGKMPENRSHTALSVGDHVTIERDGDKSVYVCQDLGWELLSFSNEWVTEVTRLKAVK